MKPSDIAREMVGTGRRAVPGVLAGGAWLTWGLLSGGGAVPPAWWTAVGLAGALLLAASGYCLVKGRALRKAHPFAGGGLNRAFLVVCVLEGVGVGVAIQAAERLGRLDLLPAGIGMVIGLHFFGLARAFRMPAYYATGVAITLWCAIACVLFHGDALAVAVGVGTGGILWGTVAFHLARVLRSYHFSMTR